MFDIRKLWILGALAMLGGACDPYDDENKGPLEILQVLAAGDETVISDSTGNPYVLAGVPSGGTVFWVKTSKLLDGAAIQVDPMSCVPAAAVNLTVNGEANPAGWFTCYYPSGGTTAEGASVVIYQGADTGIDAAYTDDADLPPGEYSITATLTDKQGNAVPVTINASVLPAPAP